MIIFIELKELQHVTLQLENVLIWTTVSSHFALKKKKKNLVSFHHHQSSHCNPIVKTV